MTNEEIIRDVSASFFKNSLLKQPLPEAIGELISKTMALKTLQFKEYMEKKRDMYGERCSKRNYEVWSATEQYFYERKKFCDEIIKELFGGE